MVLNAFKGNGTDPSSTFIPVSPGEEIDLSECGEEKGCYRNPPECDDIEVSCTHNTDPQIPYRTRSCKPFGAG